MTATITHNNLIIKPDCMAYKHPELQACCNCNEIDQIGEEIFMVHGHYFCWTCLRAIKKCALEGRTDFKESMPEALYNAVLRYLFIKEL
jgi:hypothetical protein